MMGERKKRILRAITDDYITSGEPIGSRTIARKYNLGVSPATIRNEMADLEENGYLEQPHTSAGRIPSDKGYRFYVDDLLSPPGLSEPEVEFIKREYESMNKEIGSLLRVTAKIMSGLSEYTALVLGPQLQKTSFRHIQMIHISPDEVLMILVVDPGLVETRVVQMKTVIPPRELDEMVGFLNRRLYGLTIKEVERTLVEELKKRFFTYNDLVKETIELLLKGLKDQRAERVYIEGISNLLNYPEFYDVDKARMVFNIFEDEEFILSILDHTTGSSGIKVTIGRENPVEEIHDCSVITATYEIKGRVIGTIGIVGPKRMNYGKVINLMEYVARRLNESLKRGGC